MNSVVEQFGPIIDKKQRTPAGWVLESGLAKTAKEAINLIRKGRIQFDGKVVVKHTQMVNRPREIMRDA